ncbi:uncharacterized protein LOC114427785 [Parambassis ranga]|uniref:Uncharacterized protein LOC114427785 n=1 Tax=Parambassis ranga TaxID=210632 RepID=A0A6P7HML5_9TELE|nr:uncharacterized protein LOC114427785 [Parambassis ranga]
MKCAVERQTTYPVEVWKLFFQKASPALDQALETFAATAPNISSKTMSHALEALGELRIASFNQSQLQDENFIRSWFQTKMRPFLASPSSNFLICLSSNNFSCQTYQIVIQAFSSQRAFMDRDGRQAVFTYFIKPFLSRNDSSDLGCVSSTRDSKEWLRANFGNFSDFATLQDLQALNPNFSSVDASEFLTISQQAQLATTQLSSAQDVAKLMAGISTVDFGAFFDIVSPAIEARPGNYSDKVKSAFLQAVFDRGGLSLPTVSDKDFVLWLRVRLRPFLINLSPTLVTPLFTIGTNRSCNSSQEMLTLLDTLNTTLSNDTQREIYNNTLLFFQGQRALKCYTGGSFYIYLRNTFLSFGFPDLSTLLSLVPPKRQTELLSTISTSELQQLFSLPKAIFNSFDVCTIFNNYNKTPAFLETEDVPDNVKKVTLPCVWPLALSSNSSTDVSLWFNLRLRKYLKFLSKSLISVTEVQKASCFGFQKMVSVMGNNFTYNGSDFGEADVYTSIKNYLSTGSEAKCYNADDAELNSTAWFVNNIGKFVTFITVNDITKFFSSSQSKLFLKDLSNLELFNNTAISLDVTNYYIKQLFTFIPNFSPIKLPEIFLCSSDVPSSVYTSVNEKDTIIILDKLKIFCNGKKNLEVFSALASNFKTFTVEIFKNLGSASSGLTISQITSVPGKVLIESLSTLSTVAFWGLGQATTIIQSITASGFQINTGAKLESLGKLVVGILSETIDTIAASELLTISKSVTFVANILEGPAILLQTLVNKIISLDTNPVQMLKNVPDAMATLIPRTLLILADTGVDLVIERINNKALLISQAVMFFEKLAETTFDIEKLSPSVLQGFTCTTVQKMSINRIKELIFATRPRADRVKVLLKESQLTCMYNLIKDSLSTTLNFASYPSDMLLYFSPTDINKNNCRAFFTALGAADFSVPSAILNKGAMLLNEAKACLGINGLSLSKEIVEILGNMVCTLDAAYIENSDPVILEKLKNCKDFSSSQVAAIEKLLGTVNTWNQKTLENLGNIPLYLTKNIWGRITTDIKKSFLKTFMPFLRQVKIPKIKLKILFPQVIVVVVKRGAGCTVGNITQVTVNDDSFPFGYDLTQFDLCLDVPVLKDNLNAICDKVDDDDLQKVILRKLNQAYPSGVSDQDVQVLGSVSRVASLDDIAKWNITKVDTLAALMKAEDGPWEAAKSKEIITKYLSTSGNSLGSTELNIIGSNLCSLPTSTLTTIPPDSIRNGNPLNVASCSTEQKKVLYKASNTAFSSHRASPSTYYNLIKSTICGAPLADIVALSTQNINMDIDDFRSLEFNVITALTVTNVKGLMGNQLRDLKVFEKDPVVQTWVNLQLQSDLDTLGIGLISNRTEPTTTAGPVVTTSGGVELGKPQTSIILAALLITVLQMLRQPA